MNSKDLIENWLLDIASNNSGSKNTYIQYKRALTQFLDEMQLTAEEIIQDNEEAITDRQIRLKYTPIIKEYKIKLIKKELTSATIKIKISVIKQFFKYNDIQLGTINAGKVRKTKKERQITKREIILILEKANLKEKAVYSIIMQSGLRAHTISRLQIKDFENIRAEKPTIPQLIKVPIDKAKGCYAPYFTFIGKEAVRYIQLYLLIKEKELTENSIIFTQKDEKTETDPQIFSQNFRRTLMQLKKQKQIDFKQEQSRNRTIFEISLYSLRKYFRNQNKIQDHSHREFFMGHTNGVDQYYKDKSFSEENIEKLRKVYEEQALPYLKINKLSPDETSNKMEKLTEENKNLKADMKKIVEHFETKIEKLDEEMCQRIENELKKVLNNAPKEVAILTAKQTLQGIKDKKY